MSWQQVAKRRTAARHERMRIISQLAMYTFDQKDEDCDRYKQISWKEGSDREEEGLQVAK